MNRGIQTLSPHVLLISSNFGCRLFNKTLIKYSTEIWRTDEGKISTAGIKMKSRKVF